MKVFVAGATGAMGKQLVPCRRSVPRWRAVNSVVNPDKLARLGPVADMGALLRASVTAGRGEPGA